jgi:hypothetical protein
MLLASISAEIGGITRAGAMEFLKIYFLIALIGAIATASHWGQPDPRTGRNATPA